MHLLETEDMSLCYSKEPKCLGILTWHIKTLDVKGKDVHGGYNTSP